MSAQTEFYRTLKQSMEQLHADMVKLVRERDELQRKVDDEILTREYGQAEIEAVERRITKLQDEGERTAYDLISKRLEELDAADTLKPEELNADCELLKYDILTQKDIDQLAKRNGSNPTATRLIQRYAEAHGLEVDLPSYLVELMQNKRATDGAREIVRVGLKWVGDEKRGQDILSRLFAQVGV